MYIYICFRLHAPPPAVLIYSLLPQWVVACNWYCFRHPPCALWLELPPHLSCKLSAKKSTDKMKKETSSSDLRIKDVKFSLDFSQHKNFTETLRKLCETSRKLYGDFTETLRKLYPRAPARGDLHPQTHNSNFKTNETRAGMPRKRTIIFRLIFTEKYGRKFSQ